jgi:hypothetical protein
MITALVQFRLPQPVSREQARALFAASAPSYRDVPGLVRKYYLLSEDGTTAGGVYLWKSRADAERLYDAQWRRTIEERYGAPPSVTYFASPVVVDNLAGSIETES